MTSRAVDRRPAAHGGAATESIARWIGLGAVVVLVVLAMALPPAFGWDVHVANLPPLFGDWRPHVGPGTLPALAIAVLVVVVGPRFASRVRWRVLLLGSVVTAFAWIVSLAASEGVFGIARVLEWRSEYLQPAREVTDVGATLRGYIARIPLDAPDNWPVNPAGHPPGALLFFVLLVRVGLGTGLAAGLVVIAVAATTPAALLIAVRRLGAEAAARRAAPFLAVGPSAVWLGVSGDAVAAAAGAWGLCALAVSATATGRAARTGGAAGAGLLLGCAVMLSYGLPLLGVLVLAILLVARTIRPLPVVLAAGLAVVLLFAVAGFAWWEAYPVLIDRYWDGVARLRPFAYWVWADLAVLALAAGPIIGPGLATAVVRRTSGPLVPQDRVIVLLVLAAGLIVVLADTSGLSKAEVERIWLPFMPWLLLGAALLPERWRRIGLAGNVATGFAIEHLMHLVW